MENGKGGGHHFQLRPFSSGVLAEKLSISGSLVRKAGTLQIGYLVEGALEQVSWPTPSPVTGRRHELWRETCFEVFIGIKNTTAYWEVNLRGDGCWNVYHFTSYRTGMGEEYAVSPPVIRVHMDDNLLSLNCIVDFKNVIDTNSNLEVGGSCVVQATDGSTEYWAAAHPGEKPDFHNRQSFVFELPGMRESTNEQESK